MRKITANAVQAFLSARSFNSGNTSVVVRYNADRTQATVKLRLHGNSIARYDLEEGISRSLEVSSAGWETSTTKERLNGLPGVCVNQKAFVWYLNGKVWDGQWAWLGSDV